jgi:hypothetical protein
MKTKMQLIDIIRHGEFKMSYNPVKCSKCFRNDVKEYLIFKDYILCKKCIDNINGNDKKPIPLVTMQQNIYINEFNNNNIYFNEINGINECIINFKILNKVSPVEFKVEINNKIKVLHYQEIIDKFWDYLSFADKEFIMSEHS